MIPLSAMDYRLWTKKSIFTQFLKAMNRFYGTGVAMVTPFATNGQVDYEALGRIVWPT